MTELEQALRRAEQELAVTKTAIAAARGSSIETLAKSLATLQAQCAELDERARGLETDLELLRHDEKKKLAELEE